MIKAFYEGLLSSNVYVVYDGGEAIIVDCGMEIDKIKTFVLENGLSVKSIVLTHGHYDHVNYLEDYVREFENASVICHADEIKVLTDSVANVSVYFGAPRVYDFNFKTVDEGDIISVGSIKFTVLHTPGHTPGGICLYCEEKKLLFTGDTLFHSGYGRTDFKYGDSRLLLCSVLRLLRLDSSTTFYSGHGDKSKIKNEQ